MKNTFQLSTFFKIVCALFITITFFSCKKDFETTNNEFNNSIDNSTIHEPTLSDAGNITNNNGILVFESEDKMNIALEVLTGMSDTERQKWEKQHGFVSLRTQYEKVMQAEYDKLLAPYKNMTDEEIENLPFPGHSEEYNTAVASGLIKKLTDPDGGESYELRHKAGYLAYITNSEGFVLAGRKLFLIQDNMVKTKEEATLADRAFLKTQMSSNEIEKITVTIIEKKTIRGNVNFNSSDGWNYVNNNKNKGLLEVYFQMNYINNTLMSLNNTQFHSVAKRKSWGQWINNPGNHFYYWNAYSFFSIYNYNYTQYRFHFFNNPGLVNGGAIPPNTNNPHFYIKYSSGGDSWKTIAGGTYFSPPVVNGEQWNFDNNNHYIKYHLRAGIPGGSNGITCTASYNWVP